MRLVTAVESRDARVSASTGFSARADRMLFAAAALFTVAVIVHGADHTRRGADSVAGDVFVAGTLAMVLEVGVVVFICARHRLAPLAALAVGASLAPGYVVVHFLPERSWLSDSFVSGGDVHLLSWFAATFEVAAALTLALVGGFVLHRRGGLVSAAELWADERPLSDGLRHPLALVFLLASIAVVVVNLGQLWI